MRVLGHHQDLRHIKLSNGYMPDLPVASLLSIHPRDHTESQGGCSNRVSPALEELELDHIRFSTTLEEDLETNSLEHNSDGEEIVLDMAGWWEGDDFHVVDRHD